MIMRVFLAGRRDAEHLRIEREGDRLVFTSHEFRVGSGAQQSRYLDRQVITVEASVLMAALERLGIHDDKQQAADRRGPSRQGEAGRA